MTPRVPETRRATVRPPICPTCLKVFKKAFTKANDLLDEAIRVSDDDILARAKKRAQAVKIGDEWACPRCTTLDNPLGQELMLMQAYPNRASRRQAVAQTKRNNNRTRKGGGR